MNNQIKILLTIWIAGLLTTGSQKAFTQSLPGYFGVNLAGAEFGSSTGVHGRDCAYPDAKELAYYKTNGFWLIRLPLKWEGLQPVLGGTLDSAKLNRLITVLDIAHEKEIYIIPEAISDVVNFARLIKVPGMYSWGLNDEVCPLPSMYAAYNVIRASKNLLLSLETGHWTYLEQTEILNNWLIHLLKNRE